MHSLSPHFTHLLDNLNPPLSMANGKWQMGIRYVDSIVKEYVPRCFCSAPGIRSLVPRFSQSWDGVLPFHFISTPIPLPTQSPSHPDMAKRLVHIRTISEQTRYSLSGVFRSFPFRPCNSFCTVKLYFRIPAVPLSANQIRL